MLGTAVPETAIDEDGDALRREHHIRAAASTRKDSQVDSIAQTSAVQLTTNG